MKKVLLIALSMVATSAFAKTECTTAPKEQWQDQNAFQEQLKAQGYTIKKFKVTAGQCYEI